MQLTQNKTFLKIPISQIRELDNVRLDYNEERIAELAESIKKDGLLNPLTVSAAKEDEDGEPYYELIAGHCRLRAVKKLVEEGMEYGAVDCCIRRGDRSTLQLVENLQRQELEQVEKEEAIYKMIESGLSLTEIARKISKSVSYVSDIYTGRKVRERAESMGADTSSISTKALSQLRSFEAGELKEAVQETARRGGTVQVATEIMQEIKKEQARRDNLFELEPEEDDAPEFSPFKWENYPLVDKQLFVRELTNKLRGGMADDVEFCIKHSGRVAPISGVEYRPGENRLIFLSDSPDSVTLGGGL